MLWKVNFTHCHISSRGLKPDIVITLNIWKTLHLTFYKHLSENHSLLNYDKCTIIHMWKCVTSDVKFSSLPCEKVEKRECSVCL